jgi:hypothetical protein
MGGAVNLAPSRLRLMADIFSASHGLDERTRVKIFELIALALCPSVVLELTLQEWNKFNDLDAPAPAIA